MTLENKVVLSTGIIVDIEVSEQGHSERMEAISQRLRDAVAQTFSGDPSIMAVAGIAYDWLNDSDSNFGRCVDCNRLVSKYEKPNQIRVLVDARVTDGNLCATNALTWDASKQTQRSDGQQNHNKEYDEPRYARKSPKASHGNGLTNSATS
jgi:hypothetical protein